MLLYTMARSLQLGSAPATPTFSVPARSLHASAARAVPHRQWLQDRISSDGTWFGTAGGPTPSSDGSSSSQQQQQQQQQHGQQPPYVIGSAMPGSRQTAPMVPPISDAALDRLADLVQRARGTLVLTGAGCSTESGVPDYRGPAGAYTLSNFKPMTHQQFMASPQNRSRYWARSFAGWLKFSSVQPNAAHESIARLQQRGWVHGLITQNVDRLHQKAGAAPVLELHGTTHEVVCMSCGRLTCRHDFQERLAALNPDAAAATAAVVAEQDAANDRLRLLRAGPAAAAPRGLREVAGSSSGGPSGSAVIVQQPDGDARVVQRPDGDMELAAAATQGFIVPSCTACGGILKPHVVFFGDGLPASRAQQALDLARSCSSMLVVGSSLAVWSAYRLVRAAVENGAELAICTVGPTRADDLAQLKLEGRVGETLARLAAHPSLQVPPLY